eukprot:INCI5097.12.p1 GENE.INCI5097.12~~INCI5097.12.p1  ORF type:complete len:372 (-),score=44.34 INCI5097.12:1356-2471(-)
MLSGGLLALRTTLRGRSAVNASSAPLAATHRARPASTSTACTHLTSRQLPLVRQPRGTHPRASTTSSSLSATSGGSRATAGVDCGSVRSNHAAGALHYAQHQQIQHSSFGRVSAGGHGSLPDLHARIVQLLTARTQFALDTTAAQLSSFSDAMDSGKSLADTCASKKSVVSSSPVSDDPSETGSTGEPAQPGGDSGFDLFTVQTAAHQHWDELLPAPAPRTLRHLTKNCVRKKKLLTWEESQGQLYACMRNLARVGRWGHVIDVFWRMTELFPNDELELKSFALAFHAASKLYRKRQMVTLYHTLLEAHGKELPTFTYMLLLNDATTAKADVANEILRDITDCGITVAREWYVLLLSSTYPRLFQSGDLHT